MVNLIKCVELEVDGHGVNVFVYIKSYNFSAFLVAFSPIQYCTTK